MQSQHERNAHSQECDLFVLGIVQQDIAPDRRSVRPVTLDGNRGEYNQRETDRGTDDDVQSPLAQ